MSGTNHHDEPSRPGEWRWNKLAAAGAVTAIAGAGVMLFALNPAQSNAAATKVFICKFVGTPGVNETLQTGQNPIDVDINAVNEDPVVVGSFFNDQQGRSLVLAFDTGQPTPPASDCLTTETSSPPPSTPPSTPPTSSSAAVSGISSSNPPPVTTTVTEAPTSAGALPSSVAAGLHTPVSGDTAALGGALMALGLGGLATAVRPWKRGAH